MTELYYFKGNSTNGEALIRALEVKGGQNLNNFRGDSKNYYYYIDQFGVIQLSDVQSVITQIENKGIEIKASEIKTVPFTINTYLLIKNGLLCGDVYNEKGEPVRIICIDRHSPFCVVGLIRRPSCSNCQDETDEIFTYTKDGNMGLNNSPYNLVIKIKQNETCE